MRVIFCLVCLLALSGCGDSQPSPLTPDELSRRDAAVKILAQSPQQVTVAPINAQNPHEVLITYHGELPTYEGRKLAKTVYDSLGGEFWVVVKDDTDKEIAHASEGGAGD